MSNYSKNLSFSIDSNNPNLPQIQLVPSSISESHPMPSWEIVNYKIKSNLPPSKSQFLEFAKSNLLNQFQNRLNQIADKLKSSNHNPIYRTVIDENLSDAFFNDSKSKQDYLNAYKELSPAVKKLKKLSSALKRIVDNWLSRWLDAHDFFDDRPPIIINYQNKIEQFREKSNDLFFKSLPLNLIPNYISQINSMINDGNQLMLNIENDINKLPIP